MNENGNENGNADANANGEASHGGGADSNAATVAKLDETREVVVQDPFSPDVYHRANDVCAMIKSVRARLALRKQEFAALGDLGQAPLEAVKTIAKAIKEDDSTLVTFDRRLGEALLDLSGFKAFVVQTKGTGAKIDPLSVRGQFAEMLKAANAVIGANKPKEAVHTYFYSVTCTDREHLKIQREIAKVYPGFGLLMPQSVAVMNRAVKLFEEGNEPK